jgi:hypothetical protein
MSPHSGRPPDGGAAAPVLANRRDPGLRCGDCRDRRLQSDGAFQLHAYREEGHRLCGAIIANHSFNGTGEWAYGVTPWFEQGLYLPVYSLYSDGRGATINGFKIRELFVRPNAAEHKFFYGLNFEFSVNAKYWQSKRITSEVRPIVGLHLDSIDLIFNPIMDTNYTGGPGNLEFVPATRVAYKINKTWAVAAEEYADLGPLRQFMPIHDQFHEVWAVTDYKGKVVNVEAGIGIGATAGADRLTLKLMISRDLNHKGTP